MTVPRQGLLVYVINAADIGGGGTGVTSLNALTGAVVATTPNSTLSIGTSGQDVTFDIDLATANLWAAAQTFPSSDLLILNPAGTHAYTFAGAAITAARTLTLPLTTAADTLAALGVVQAWSALQTFNAGDFAFGGYGADSITSPAQGDIWYYNGTNLVNLAPGTSGQYLQTKGASANPVWAAGPTITTQLGFIINAGVVSTTLSYCPPGFTNVNANINWEMPLTFTGTLKNFRVNVVTNGLSGADTITLTIQTYTTIGTVVGNALTVTFAGGVTGLVDDLTHTISVTAGQYVNMACVTSAGSVTLTLMASVEYTNP